jgi:hypothetical protein
MAEAIAWLMSFFKWLFHRRLHLAIGVRTLFVKHVISFTDAPWGLQGEYVAGNKNK